MVKLSKAEIKVYEYLLKRLSNREISELLFVQENSIKFHLTAIYKKLNVISRHEAVLAKDKILNFVMLSSTPKNT